MVKSEKEKVAKTSAAKKLTKSSKLYKTILKAIEDKKGENVISLDLRKIDAASADFFIVCEAVSAPQIRAIFQNIETEVQKECDESPYHHEGLENLEWVIIDYVNIVIHIMQPEIRKYYRLEEMWSDGVADIL
ncbi:MAG: ribosome silencing factor [Pseudopedobacter saltans]|uniref:Ribosomal silencing factor RsfS n=1 Tax=Pseudopedobacter saltans TaxID=151895 RepID=A0A2W5F2C0_9SPHI|nr:MAG: ribosome silencing factor [Pseudopedobacter saltans]